MKIMKTICALRSFFVILAIVLLYGYGFGNTDSMFPLRAVTWSATLDYVWMFAVAFSQRQNGLRWYVAGLALGMGSWAVSQFFFGIGDSLFGIRAGYAATAVVHTLVGGLLVAGLVALNTHRELP